MKRRLCVSQWKTADQECAGRSTVGCVQTPRVRCWCCLASTPCLLPTHSLHRDPGCLLFLLTPSPLVVPCCCCCFCLQLSTCFFLTCVFLPVFVCMHASSEGGRGYSFHRVRPGNYLVTGVKEGWCWEGSRLPLTISQTDGIAPDLKHKGYELQVCVCVCVPETQQWNWSLSHRSSPNHPTLLFF